MGQEPSASRRGHDMLRVAARRPVIFVLATAWGLSVRHQYIFTRILISPAGATTGDLRLRTCSAFRGGTIGYGILLGQYIQLSK